MRNLSWFALAIVAIVLVAIFNSFYVVRQDEQALILQVGEPRAVINAPGTDEAGLYFKIPVIQTVEKLDRKNLGLDIENIQVLASDQRRLAVDAFVRWRISDPLQFYQSLRTIPGAANQLNDVTKASIREVMGDVPVPEIISGQRSELMENIREKVANELADAGISIIDVRIRQADLPREVAEGRFRQDLYYRLNAFELTVPPLRERRSEIAKLARRFVDRYVAMEPQSPVRHLAADAIALLQRYDWPGNIRQLENAIHRAVVLGETLSRQAQRGMALALAGMLLLLGGDLLQDPGTLHGNGLALVSGLLAGAYYLGGRSLRQTVALADYALVVYAFSALALWSAVFAAGDAWQSLSQREYLLFGLMALVPTLLGHTLQNWALGYLPAFVVTVTLLAEPVGAGLLALAIFGEQPGWPELLGGAAVLAGIWAVAIPRKLSAA